MFSKIFDERRVSAVFIFIFATFSSLPLSSEGGKLRVPIHRVPREHTQGRLRSSSMQSSQAVATMTQQHQKKDKKQGIPNASSVEPRKDGGNTMSPAQLKELAENTIKDISFSTEEILNPVVRLRVRTLVADALWYFQPDKARDIVSQEFSRIASISIPRNELRIGKIWSSEETGKPPSYKGSDLEMVKGRLRRDMLAIASSHDVAFARTLVDAEKKDRPTGADGRTDEVLSTAASLAETNAEAAARIIRNSLKNGITDEVAFLLVRLRETSPGDASAIFNQVLTAVRGSGDLWELQKLIPYILPTERERLTGRHYLADPQRTKDAILLIELATALLAHRIETEPPSNMPAELVRREYYIWRNLLQVFKDVKPESTWLVNTRMTQLSALIPQAQQGPAQGPWSDERVKQLLGAADVAVGDKRDGYLSSAAFAVWRFGQGDYDRATSIAEKIHNEEFRKGVLGDLNFQAGSKALIDAGPEKAYSFAQKIEAPVMRSRLHAAIVSALRSVSSKEKTETLHNEMLQWLRSRERDTDTAWGVLEYLDGLTTDDAERSFTALDILVTVLNSASFDPPEKPIMGRVYWYPEFHNFRKSLALPARTDFDRGLQAIQMLRNREVAMIVEASYCVDYLMWVSKNKKSSSKPSQ